MISRCMRSCTKNKEPFLERGVDWELGESGKEWSGLAESGEIQKIEIV